MVPMPTASEVETRISRSCWLRGPKRVCDVLAAAALLLLLSPLLLVVSGLIKVTSRGPVFFVQTRGGWRGRSFRLVKFRTMRAGRTPDPKELVPLKHPDITAIGYLLRRSKIDELPQLFNVLAGSMSLVGPRPTLLDQVAAYDPFRRQRLEVRPGVTGLAQVYCNALVPWDERILYDVAYVRGCGPLLDLAILMRTILVLFAGEAKTTRPFRASRFARLVEVPADFETLPAEGPQG